MTETTNRENPPTISPTSRWSWRQWHTFIGLSSSPFILISAICGGLLLFRKTGLYERRGAFRETIQRLHSYEILLTYEGVVAVVLMILTAVTGVVLYCQMYRRR